MPIIDIEIVGPLPTEVSEGLAARLADAIAEVLGSRPQGTWVKLRQLALSDYAENQGELGEELRPIFVSVLQRSPPEGERLATQALRLSECVAVSCEREREQVHIIYCAPAAGRVAFGGVLNT